MQLDDENDRQYRRGVKPAVRIGGKPGNLQNGERSNPSVKRINIEGGGTLTDDFYLWNGLIHRSCVRAMLNKLDRFGGFYSPGTGNGRTVRIAAGKLREGITASLS